MIKFKIHSKQQSLNIKYISGHQYSYIYTSWFWMKIVVYHKKKEDPFFRQNWRCFTQVQRSFETITSWPENNNTPLYDDLSDILRTLMSVLVHHQPVKRKLLEDEKNEQSMDTYITDHFMNTWLFLRNDVCTFSAPFIVHSFGAKWKKCCIFLLTI